MRRRRGAVPRALYAKTEHCFWKETSDFDIHCRVSPAALLRWRRAAKPVLVSTFGDELDGLV